MSSTDTTAVRAAKARLDEAIANYLDSIDQEHLVVTDWIVSVAVVNPADAEEETSYLYVRAPGTRFHSALGLLYQTITNLRSRN